LRRCALSSMLHVSSLFLCDAGYTKDPAHDPILAAGVTGARIRSSRKGRRPLLLAALPRPIRRHSRVLSRPLAAIYDMGIL